MNQIKVDFKPYYFSICKDKVQYPYLNENLSAEVIIIGGGITGALLGYYFSKSNIKTVLLEKTRAGAGNTASAPGFLKYELDLSSTKLKDSLTSSEILKAYKVGVKGISEIEKIVEEEGNNCSFHRCDCLRYTNQYEEINDLYEEYHFRKRGGFDCIYIDETINPFSFAIKAGIISKRGGATLNPYAFTQMLLKAATKYGLKVFENTEVVNTCYYEDSVEVKTNFDYLVKGKIIICATGDDITLFTYRHLADIKTTYQIVSSKITEKVQEALNMIILNNNGDYLSATSDGSLLFGGESICDVEETDYENICESNYHELENKLKMILGKDNLKIDYKFYVLSPKTKDNLGYIGQDLERPNLYYCLGYGSNGILYSVMGAKALLQMYLDQKNKRTTEPKFDLKLFDLSRFKKIKKE